MQKFFSVCLLSVTSLMLQGMNPDSQPKSRPGSAKRTALSQSDLGQSVKQQDINALSSSAPLFRSPSMLIPQPKKKYNDASPSSFTALIGSPDQFDVLTYTATTYVFNKQQNSFDDSSIPK